MLVSEENKKLRLKKIYELLGERFFIPSYQRGYRWSAIQVQELLDDIWEFSQKDANGTQSFYCLQPIVVVKSERGWDVVDGQQRLTTLYIILHYLEKEHLRRDLNDAYKKSLYSLKYETRPESESFLQNIQPELAAKNIDFFHIVKAYEAVAEWFVNKDYNDNNKLLSTLLAKPEQNTPSVKVIWYDLSDECNGNDYAVDVFSRINVGKIPLTNAELVKALFLQSSHFQEDQVRLKQLQIASEWDAIEKQLQEQDFWHFIYKPDPKRTYETRIEYIFDLMKSKPIGGEPYFTFHEFNKDFREPSADIMALWESVVSYFLTFDAWFRDRELYHLIGFLVECGHSVAKIKEESERAGTTKTDFKNYLNEAISKEVSCQLDELSYGDKAKEIKKVLLLFNIQTLLATQDADFRFSFDRYKEENWDIEHIRSQTDKDVTGKNRKLWLEDVLEYFTNSRHPVTEKDISNISDKDQRDFINRISNLLRESNIDDTNFKALYDQVSHYFNGDSGVDLDGIGNLALLDAETNRSYKNALFPVKRKRIIENDKNGKFVPICTKNVFLKFYSKKFSDAMYWKDSDAADYLSEMGRMLKKYGVKGGQDE
jgi:hypothetical protein